MLKRQQIESGLAHCYGTDGYHYNQLFGKNFVYTDGIKYLLEAADAYWLMQAIFSYKRKEDFQVWNLKVVNSKAVLTMKEDTGCHNLVEQEIPFTDFPLDEIEFYAVNDHCGQNCEWCDAHVVLMLKTEY